MKCRTVTNNKKEGQGSLEVLDESAFGISVYCNSSELTWDHGLRWWLIRIRQSTSSNANCRRQSQKPLELASVALNGSTSLTFNLSNPNTASSLSGIGFTDTLPSGQVVSTPNGLTGNCGGGTITASAGSNSVSLSGATLAASASCTFAVNVTGTASGTQKNTTSAVTSTEAGSGATASASLIVAGPSQQPPQPADITPISGQSYYVLESTQRIAGGPQQQFHDRWREPRPTTAHVHEHEPAMDLHRRARKLLAN